MRSITIIALVTSSIMAGTTALNPLDNSACSTHAPEQRLSILQGRSIVQGLIDLSLVIPLGQYQYRFGGIVTTLVDLLTDVEERLFTVVQTWCAVARLRQGRVRGGWRGRASSCEWGIGKEVDSVWKSDLGVRRVEGDEMIKND